MFIETGAENISSPSSLPSNNFTRQGRNGPEIQNKSFKEAIANAMMFLDSRQGTYRFEVSKPGKTDTEQSNINC